MCLTEEMSSLGIKGIHGTRLPVVQGSDHPYDDDDDDHDHDDDDD